MYSLLNTKTHSSQVKPKSAYPRVSVQCFVSGVVKDSF